jgi:hypothetical protein
MNDSCTFHVYSHRAYRSEIALFRAEGVTANEAEQVSAPASISWLWRVVGSTERDLITHDCTAALGVFIARSAEVLQSIEVAG